jgi:hypothetical protein
MGEKRPVRIHESILLEVKTDTTRVLCKNYLKYLYRTIPCLNFFMVAASLVVVPIVVSIIVGIWIFDYQYNNTVANERKELANGFLNDIEYVN